MFDFETQLTVFHDKSLKEDHRSSLPETAGGQEMNQQDGSNSRTLVIKKNIFNEQHK